MTRTLIAVALAMTGLMTLAHQSHASSEPWQKHREASRTFASEGKWKRACRQGVIAGALMAEANVLSSDYMGKIGNRCSKAGS
jgi:hypothetical protein